MGCQGEMDSYPIIHYRETLYRPMGAPIGHGGELDQPLQPLYGVVFHRGTVQTGHLLLQEGFTHRLLLTHSSISLRDDTAAASDLRISQAETDGKG
jgi:hypothetical protein